MAWYRCLMSSRSTVGLGNFISSASSVSTTMRDTARLRNHLWLEGMMNHGAWAVLQRPRASSNAAVYASQYLRSV